LAVAFLAVAFVVFLTGVFFAEAITIILLGHLYGQPSWAA
jgi:hypothetical protein